MMFSFSGPAEVRGFYQRIRDFIQPILILVFMVAPWVSINNQPLILLDFFNRHFVLFGVVFFSHDAPLIFFVVILVILAIFILTALFGRIWCGWSCPQTVFIHGLFNKIEKIILGSYTERYSFFRSEDTINRKAKILTVYAVFLIFCWLLAHSFGAYFLGAKVVTQYIIDGPTAHLRAFSILGVLTAVLFFNFTFFREKFCFFICPYGRFQNSLLDHNSLVVFYDTDRGEPRGNIKQQDKQSQLGDCVDCNRCVRVCPTKIDIREGFQLECIACGKCIDACNEVMHKTNRPKNLISYETGDRKKVTFLRFRLVLYISLFILFFSSLIIMLSHRTTIDFNVARGQLGPFSARLENNQRILQNKIFLHLKNQTGRMLLSTVTLSEDNIKSGYKLLTPAAEITLQPEQDLTIPAFIEIESSLFLSDKSEIQIVINDGKSSILRTIKFVRVE